MRRAKGEGSVVKLKNGRYQARVRIDGKVVSRNAKTKAEAVKLLKEIKSPCMTWELAERALSRRQLAESSLRRLWSTIRTYIPDEELPSEEEINRRLEEIDKSHSTVKKVRDAYMMIAREAGVEMDLRVRRERKKDVFILSDAEMERLVSECLRKNAVGEYIHQRGPAYVLMYLTGMRVGEVCALDESDLESDRILVRKTMVGKRVQPMPKSESSIRYVYLNPEAVRLWKDVKKDHPDPAVLSKDFRRILDDLKIDVPAGHSCHLMRDMYATTLYRNHIDLLTISKLLGHSSVRVTEAHYIAITEAQKRAAVSKIGVRL